MEVGAGRKEKVKQRPTDERWKIWNLSLYSRSLCLFKRVRVERVESVESVAAEMDWVDGIDGWDRQRRYVSRLAPVSSQK